MVFDLTYNNHIILAEIFSAYFIYFSRSLDIQGYEVARKMHNNNSDGKKYVRKVEFSEQSLRALNCLVHTENNKIDIKKLTEMPL